MTDGQSFLQSPIGATRGWWDDLETEERNTIVGLAVFGGLLLAATAVGILNPTYLLYLLTLAGMFTLMTLGLNVQWGYTGLVNFSVIAFWGIGAYSAAMVTAERSPLGWELHPVWGVVVAVVASALLATLIAVPTLRLRADYLAIATLGFAEIVRMVINNERAYTNGSAGIPGIPSVAEWVESPDLVSFLTIALLVAVVYLVLRRAQLSPWGRVQRTIRADEDLAQALGKNTFRFKLQSFVLGSVIMALAGVAYVHLITPLITPTGLEPIRTFYVWIGIILGGSGSNRGAVVGGLTIVAIRQAPSFIRNQLLNVPAIAPYVSEINVGALRLFLVGVLVILIVRYRSSGLLPPKREHIWSKTLEDRS
ncbi:branched-chain amino acid ABC transporter permease [Halobacteriales archaeon QS_1_68_20]|nr:MAG: branched-chain amino acid ABC transporter permease [Halobacteriales archaeon QS_1_68_20]